MNVNKKMTDIKFGEFIQIIEKWSKCGERTTTRGARLICPAPHIAREAWFHVLYSGLSESDIAKLQTKIILPMPNDFKTFIAFTNGADLFGYNIHIWGLKYSNVRTGDEAWQPFDLELHNRKTEKPIDRPAYILMFGSSNKGESKLFFDTRSGIESSRVGETLRDKFSPINFWPDFWTWLFDESKRLSNLFDSEGKPRR